MFLLSSADLFQINFIKNNNLRTLSECQMVWIQNGKMTIKFTLERFKK